jgi:hypothetical protein
MTQQINDIEFMFVRYGFLGSPLSRKQIVSLLIRGFDYDDIYNFGCNAYSEGQTANYYHN